MGFVVFRIFARRDTYLVSPGYVRIRYFRVFARRVVNQRKVIANQENLKYDDFPGEKRESVKKRE